MSGRAASDSDDEAVDITEYSDRGKKLKNSKTAWTTQAPKTMREELEVAESEATFYRDILDVIIARLDTNMETEDVERLVLPPRAPSDVRKKLRKYRVEAKNIIDFIDDKLGDESDDENGNEDEKAEAIFLTTLIEKLCTAVKEDTISSKFKLPRVPVVDVERKDRLKGYRKAGGEIVDCLKRLKKQKGDRVTQTDFPEEDCKIKQTQVTEYIGSGSSTQKVPEVKKRKIVQRTRQTQTDFEDETLGKASVNPVRQPLVALAHPPSYSTVLSDYNLTDDGVAVARPNQHQNADFSQTVKGEHGRDFLTQQKQREQQDQQNQYHHHFNDVGQQQEQQQHRISNGVFTNVQSQHTTDCQNRHTDWQSGDTDQGRHDNTLGMSSGYVFSNPGDDRSRVHGSGSDIYNDHTQHERGVLQKPLDKSSEDYIRTLEDQNLKLSCRVSLLETQLHDSQRTLVMNAYSNNAVLQRVSNAIQSGGQERSNFHHETHSSPGHSMADTVEPLTRDMSDLADKYRPIKLADKFASLYDREWIEIFKFETTDMNKSEKNAIADILEILQTVYHICIRLADEQNEDWQDQIKISKQSELPEFLRRVRKLKDDALHASLKQTQIEMAEQTIPSIRQEVATNEAFTSFYGPEVASCERFVFACVDVCWLMAVRDPPMLLDFTCKKGSKFDKDVLAAYTKIGNKVDFLVWPPVYLYEKGQLLHKGVAQLL